MKKSALTPLLITIILLSMRAMLPVPAAGQADQKAPRPIELADIMAWRRLSSPMLSNDGKFLVARISPAEGDSEVVLRRLEDGKEWRFAIGEAAGAMGPMGGGSREMAFSADSKWLAFTVYPGFREAKRLRKERRPLQNKVALIELSSGKRLDFEKIRSFAFAGEAGNWIALHAYGAESAGPAGPPAATGSGAGASRERATGSDLLLHELVTGSELNIGNVAAYAFDKRGDWLAWTIDATEKLGNGIQVRNMATGAVLPLESEKAVYRGLQWTEKGDGLAAVKGVDEKGYEEKLYSVVGFTGFGVGDIPRKTVYDPREDKEFPAGMTISPNRAPVWNDDLTALVFGIHGVKKKKEEEKKPKEGEAPAAAAAPADEPEKPELVLWHWKDSRLQPQQQVEESRDRNFSYLAAYRAAEKKFLRLADDNVRQVTPAPTHRYAIGNDTRAYELISNLDGRRYQDVYAIDMRTGERRLALRKNRWSYGASPDGTHFLYYEDGHFHTWDMTTGKSWNLTEKAPSTFWNEEDDHNVVKPPTSVIGWTSDSAHVLVSDNWDIWRLPAHGGVAVNLTGNGKKDGIRYQMRYRLDAEEKGIDAAKPIYLRAYGEWTKKGGIARIDAARPGAKMLLWEDAQFGSLMKARDAEVYGFTRETFSESPEVRIADSSLAGGRKVTETEPRQKEFLWSSGSKLIDYTSAKGDRLQGALFLPANYQPGKSYPTVVYIYEKLSQGFNAYTPPSANGFNKSVYTSQGYAVLMPDIVYKVNDPGMSAVWCVLPALEAAIATGVVDRERVAIHGHSWGGYQTSFLVTQTKAFRAAIAGAPLTDMISMYNLVYWNTGSGNMSIFESSQGRFTGSPLDVPEAYIRNSPIYHARNVSTPLLILHNDKDGAVDFTQGIEYYSTLRRLQKPVVMLQYKGENHGLRVPANMKDYTVRMREYFDHHLKGKSAPKWLDDGLPHLNK